jgi:hypothetical protein
MSRSKRLYKLQQQDSKIDRAQDRIEEIHQILSDDEALQKTLVRAKATREILADKQKILRKAEYEVEDQQAQLDKTKEKLYSGTVTNPKELADLQQKAESLQKYLDVLEDRQLEAMIEVDQAEQAHAEAQRAVQALKTQREQEHKTLQEEKGTLEADIQRLREGRQALLKNISEEDLQLYKELRQSRAGIAVIHTSDQSCGACGTRIPAALYQIARSPSQIAQCSGCKRILHVT